MRGRTVTEIETRVNDIMFAQWKWTAAFLAVRWDRLMCLYLYYLYLYLSVCLPACLPACLSVCLSVCLSFCACLA